MKKLNRFFVMSLMIIVMSSCGLHNAVMENDIDKVKQMLDDGADVNKPVNGWSQQFHISRIETGCNFKKMQAFFIDLTRLVVINDLYEIICWPPENAWHIFS